MFIVSLVKDEVTDAKWSTLSISYPLEYLNNNLYLGSHLNNDMGFPELLSGELTNISTSDDLATKFANLGCNPIPPKCPAKEIGAKSGPSQEEHTRMEVTNS